MLTMLKFVGVEEGRARPSSRDSQVEGECCACLFLVMRVGVVQGLNWELSVVFAAGRTRKPIGQQSAELTEAQSVELAETHGEYGAILDWHFDCIGLDCPDLGGTVPIFTALTRPSTCLSRFLGRTCAVVKEKRFAAEQRIMNNWTLVLGTL